MAGALAVLAERTGHSRGVNSGDRNNQSPVERTIALDRTE